MDQLDARFRMQQAGNMLGGRLSADLDPTWSNFFARGDDGQAYTVYGLGQPLVLMPLVGIARTVGEPGSKGTRGLVADAVVVLLYATIVNLGLAAGCFGVFRKLRIPPRASAVGTLLLFLLTPWLIWGRSMQEEALTGALLLGAFYGMLRWRLCRCPWWLGFAGFMSAYTANIRPNAVFIAGALFLWFVISQPTARLKSVVLFLLGSLPALALFFWWNTYRFGSPLQTGWQTGDAGWSFDSSLFLNLLILPDFGLLWFAPLMLLLPLQIRRLRLRLLGVLVAGALVLHAVMLAGLPQYVGHAVGVAWGPRYLMHGVVLAGPLIWVAWLRLRKDRLRTAGLILITVSALVQFSGAFFQPRLEYAQDEYRTQRGLEDMQPYGWLPRRFANIGWWVSGDLAEKSFPKDEEYGAEILTTPDLPPLRIAASSRLESGGTVVVVAWSGFVLCLIVAGGATWLMVRRRE
ncbi:MAG: hypothetical protein KDB29_05760 [Planctomycetes bacterium]|nr:hypothetical protein [Planctomycetota bacterium]